MKVISSISGDIKKIDGRKNLFMKWIFLVNFISNFLFIKCEEYICKNNNNIGNSNCFNHIIKLPEKYRSGHFVTTKNGELIIEYSEDDVPGKGRIFYRLKPDGRGYYPGDYPIKQIEMDNAKDGKDEDNKDKQFSGRYEARNILVKLNNDQNDKEYLFSTSSWYSFTELYDLESDKYWTWFTSEFFDMNSKYIFSYIYSVLNIPNTKDYILIYIQYKQKENNAASSENYLIKKFSFELGDNGSITKTVSTPIQNYDNYDNRVISAVLLEAREKLVVYYVKNDNNSPKLKVKSYDYSLGNDKETEVSSFTIDKGVGNFFEGVYLSDDYTGVIYYLDKNSNNKLCLKLYQYDSSKDYGFETKIYKEITTNTLN